MKKILLFFLFVVSLTNLFAMEKLSKKLIITTQEWEPYSLMLDNGQVGGVATEVLKKVLDEMDIEYEIGIYPWARAQKLVQAGEADAFYAASKNTTRDAYAVISETLLPQKWYWYLKKTSSLDPTESAFKEKSTVSAILGSNMLKDLQKNKYKVSASPVNMENLVKMLDAERMDAILVNDLVMKNYLEKLGISETEYKKTVYLNKPLGIYFSKKFLDENKWFLEKFNETLEKHNFKD